MATVIGAFVCSMLALSALGAIAEGFATGIFGRARFYGFVTLADRPVAFLAVGAGYIAAAYFCGWGAWSLLRRLRGRS
jgi:hypothetical protein